MLRKHRIENFFKGLNMQFIRLFTLLLCLSLPLEAKTGSTSSSKFSKLQRIVTVQKKQELFKQLKAPAEFLSHNSSKPYGTYLIRNLPFSPAKRLKEAVEKALNLELMDRGEAHITVITPPEYDRMKAHNSAISMNSIEDLLKNFVQHSRFEVLGLGSLKGENSKKEISEVYFVVIESRQLRALRKLVAAEYDLPVEVFDPAAQDFHITLGFTKSDLFARPGFPARKDRSSLDSRLVWEKVLTHWQVK